MLQPTPFPRYEQSERERLSFESPATAIEKTNELLGVISDQLHLLSKLMFVTHAHIMLPPEMERLQLSVQSRRKALLGPEETVMSRTRSKS